jgi:murein L,D-transpeptidase YafK
MCSDKAAMTAKNIHIRILVIAFAFAAVITLFLLLFLSRSSADLGQLEQNIIPKIERQLSEKGLAFGSPIFIRIFKASAELELWVDNGNIFELFKVNPICNFSGDLGPKLKEGDHQSPEGFYAVSNRQMNPNSSYHLSFNLGFPNRYDRSHNRTGSYLMVHGNCVSIGCYAMTDEGIEEIYVLADAALASGQPFFRDTLFRFE